MRYPIALMLPLLAVSAAALAGPEGPAVPVVVTVAETRPVPLVVDGIGTVQPERAAAVRPRVEGEIVAVHFADGQEVAPGDLLFSLDTRDAAIRLRQAEAALARDEAQLARARADLGRARKLLGQGYETPQRQEQAVSEVAVLEAAVQADRAAIDAARLSIEHASVRAPILGRLGAATLREGNLARPNDSQPLVTVTQMAPVLVAFTLPERDLAAVMTRQTADPLPVRVRPQGGEAGVDCRLAFIDSAIDAATGTILMKARCANAERRLWPGQFITAEVTVAVEQALVVPETAVQLGQQGSFVFLARQDGTASVRPVRVARRSQGLAVIAEGLAAGDRVVVDGQSRLAEGTRFSERRP